MSDPLRFLVTDGYPKEARDSLQAAGMTLVSQFNADMLIQYLPDANNNHFMIPRSGGTNANSGMAATFGDPCNVSGTCTLAPQYATSFSWGYRLLAMMQYNSFLGTPVTMTTRALGSAPMLVMASLNAPSMAQVMALRFSARSMVRVAMPRRRK